MFESGPPRGPRGVVCAVRVNARGRGPGERGSKIRLVHTFEEKFHFRSAIFFALAIKQAAPLTHKAVACSDFLAQFEGCR